jgi:D-methionine transport system permease protein
MLPEATAETIYMVLASTVLACVMGFPLGIYLYAASPAGLAPRRVLYNVLSRIVNLFRSFPFIILMIMLIPFTRFIVKTSIGPIAAIIPLSIAAAPFVARIAESALSEVDLGVLTAARAMGSTNFQIICKVLIPESMPALVSGLALTMINLIGYSAMAGAIGGGGLGNLAIRYGYYRFTTDVMIAAVVVILILVEAIQIAGTFISRALLSKR